jgi:hypothetical protein
MVMSVWVVGSLDGDMLFMMTLTAFDDNSCSRIRIRKKLQYHSFVASYEV